MVRAGPDTARTERHPTTAVVRWWSCSALIGWIARGHTLGVSFTFVLNGRDLEVPGDLARGSLLEVLRTLGGVTSAKDGCAPQGQCGCCTVLVEGRARVSCVTPARRVAGRSVTTLEGLPKAVAADWANAFVDHGATQCGFCTPGIIMRFEDRRARVSEGTAIETSAVDRMLAAHLCRCTGWQGITEVGVEVLGDRQLGRRSGSRPEPPREAAARRASMEGGVPQRIDADVILSGGGFAADTAPPDALIAVPGPDGDWVVGENVVEARAAAGKVQGRRTTTEPKPPLTVPDGDWAAVLATSWVEPAYLETDASWCFPGGEPAGVLANGGAFGAKSDSPLPEVARRLADLHGRSVLALWSREDTVNHGPKRPPVALGIDSSGAGVMRVVPTAGIHDAVARVAPGLNVQEVAVNGPRTSAAIRCAGWAEALCGLVAADVDTPVGGRDGAGVRAVGPAGGWARAEVVPAGDGPAGADGLIRVLVGAGDPLDEAVLRSYVIGAVHMAAGMVCSEGLAVDEAGTVHDLTVRSFGVLSPSALPRVEVVFDPEGGESVAVSDAVFAATAAAVWRSHGFPPRWPTGSSVLPIA